MSRIDTAGAVGSRLNTTARVAPGVAGRLALELWRRPGRPAAVRRDEQSGPRGRRPTSTVGRVAVYAWGDGRTRCSWSTAGVPAPLASPTW